MKYHDWSSVAVGAPAAVARVVSGGNVGGLPAERVQGGRPCSRRQIYAHRQVLQRRHMQTDWVAQRLRADRDLNRRLSAERERNAPSRGGGACAGHGDRGGADLERLIPERVGEADANQVAAHAGEDDVANRLVVEASRVRAPRNGGLRARRPGRHPLRVVPEARLIAVVASGLARPGRGRCQSDGNDAGQDKQPPRPASSAIARYGCTKRALLSSLRR